MIAKLLQNLTYKFSGLNRHRVPGSKPRQRFTRFETLETRSLLSASPGPAGFQIHDDFGAGFSPGRGNSFEHLPTVATSEHYSHETSLVSSSRSQPGLAPPQKAYDGIVILEGFGTRGTIVVIVQEFHFSPRDLTNGALDNGAIALNGGSPNQSAVQSSEYFSQALSSPTVHTSHNYLDEPSSIPRLSSQQSWYINATITDGSTSANNSLASLHTENSYDRGFADYDTELSEGASTRRSHADLRIKAFLKTSLDDNAQVDESTEFLTGQAEDTLRLPDSPLESELRAIDRVLASIHTYDDRAFSRDVHTSDSESTSIATDHNETKEDTDQLQETQAVSELPDVDTQGGMVLLNANYTGSWSTDSLSAAALLRIPALEMQTILPGSELPMGTHQAVDVGGTSTDLPTEQSTASATSRSSRGEDATPSANDNADSAS